MAKMINEHKGILRAAYREYYHKCQSGQFKIDDLNKYLRALTFFDNFYGLGLDKIQIKGEKLVKKEYDPEEFIRIVETEPVQIMMF